MGWSAPGKTQDRNRREAHRRGDHARGDQDGDLEAAARTGGQVVQRRQRATGERQAHGEHDDALELVAEMRRAGADAEGDAPVHRGVGHRRDEQGEGIGPQGGHAGA